ncbi:RagB/SusD family nutrient uptake outer membrane protein [Aureibaculum sp. 2210JD6-5]|uniref:RagB/SusD family nutrient uptake outer membrane protein n=1 Tax=Aureibaculum sp. 2210JD6-5 TaxID=3103957 RepID=UPI002AAD86BD|nr:RagB/SusD family nutrient uptake outer membrane protein [Aureibaculum sp. 2210JD6-5]MDY7394708.1 RagB/SusD family nutrient uptake outer membrane protein [Aureibaculum sp. 2210JD6-5]
MKLFNKNSRILIGMLVVGLVVLTTSCEDYLKDELLSDTSADFTYNTPEGLEAATVGLYSLNRALYEDGEWNSARAMTMIAKSDLVFGRSGEISLYATLSWGRTVNDFGSKRFSRFWRHHYRLVDRANAVIQGAENTEMDETRKNVLIAEAKAMRANSYFTLYRMFNNIFITTEPTTPENGFDRPEAPSTEEEIFTLINSDLDFAIANLDWTTDQYGRWTQAAARHLRAKTAIWQKDYTEAALQADAVIDNGSYNLVGNTKDVFKGDYNNGETLFAIQYADPNETIGGGNMHRMNFNVVAQYNRIDGADFAIENGARGAGFLMPNEYLRNLLKEDPNDDRDDHTYYISYYTYNDVANLPAGKKVGDTIDVYEEYGSQHRNYYLTMNPGVLKYLQDDAVPDEASQVKNILIYRLAETYLIGAEAHMMNGNTAKALTYINAVRTRANATELTEIDLQAILDERARELAFEGQRWYTLKRTGKLIEFMRDHAGNEQWKFIARERIEDWMVNMPIPQSELDLLGPNYPQNSGYTD